MFLLSTIYVTKFADVESTDILINQELIQGESNVITDDAAKNTETQPGGQTKSIAAWAGEEIDPDHDLESYMEKDDYNDYLSLERAAFEIMEQEKIILTGLLLNINQIKVKKAIIRIS